MRIEGQLSHKLHKLSYPIPPAGADPATYKSEEVAPLGFRIPMPPNIVDHSSKTAEVSFLIWNLPPDSVARVVAYCDFVFKIKSKAFVYFDPLDVFVQNSQVLLGVAYVHVNAVML